MCQYVLVLFEQLSMLVSDVLLKLLVLVLSRLVRLQRKRKLAGVFAIRAFQLVGPISQLKHGPTYVYGLRCCVAAEFIAMMYNK